MRKSTLTASWLAIACWLCAQAPARAQLHRATDPVATPASSVVLEDDALALDLNPAAIGRLPAFSAALLHAEVDQNNSWLGRGDALYLAGPVIGPLSVGLTVQSLRPGPHAARPPGETNADRAMAAFALAFAPSPGVSLGLTTRTFASGNARFDGLTAIDIGLALRPSRWLALSLVGRDLFLSRSGFGTDGLNVGSSALISAGLRPFGTDAITLDVGAATRTTDTRDLGARAGVVVLLPYLGAASGLIEVEDFARSNAAWRAVAELSIAAGGQSVAFGGTGGTGFDPKLGWYAMVRAEGQERPGVPAAGRVLELELHDMTPRGLIALALTLERARTDPRIRGVLLRPRGAELGLAYAQELRLQIRALRAAGKPVLCHLDSASGSEYYACAAADRILIDPAGDLRLLGTSTNVLLFGETLRKIGVRADFIRIGPYKSAPEQATQDQMSEAARVETSSLLDDAHRRMLADLAADLGVSTDRVAAIMDQGPHLAHAAVGAGLVKASVDERELDQEALAAFGTKSVTRSLPAADGRSWGKRPAVGVVIVDDEIVDGDSVDIPFIDIHMTGGETVIDELDRMARDPSIRAIVLRVDSPGGAALASDKIWRAVRRAREQKPVIASMGAMAASGGYYVASAADEIWADPSTLTGSIGIFYGKVDVVQLADKLGVHIENFRRGKHAGADSLFRPFTDEERAALADLMRNYYRLFLARVAEGRKMTVEAVDAIARGRVYSGDAAQRLGLVDRLGGFASALIRARALGELPIDAEVVLRPPRKNRLIDYVLGTDSFNRAAIQAVAGEEPQQPLQLSPQLRSLLRTVAGLEQLGAGEPLALLPFEIEL